MAALSMKEGRENVEVKLRDVTMDDLDRLFEWVSDPEAAKYFTGTEPTKEEYRAMLTEIVSGLKTDVLMSIAVTERGEAVGVVSAKTTDDGRRDITYRVAPNWQSRGVGKKAVLAFVKEKIDHAPIVAHIREGNVASENIARALGLQPVSKDDHEPPMIEWSAVPTSLIGSLRKMPKK